MIKGFIIFSFLFLGATKSWSYSNFIGYGYASCLTCHYNAFGNGPLNDYGRALGANMVSGRLFVPDKVSDSELSEKSGFFGKVDHKNTTFRPSIDYRGIHILDKVGQSGNSSRYLHMALDANLVIRGFNDKLIGSFTYGLVPNTTAGSGIFEWDMDQFDTYSREHYIMWAVKNNLRLYVGKTDILFGIRVPDHIMLARNQRGIAQNDQVHGAFFHYYNNNWEYGAHAFVGDMDKPEDERVEGFSLSGEYNLATDFRLGASFLAGKTFSSNRTIAALHSRLAFYKGGSLLFELGKFVDKGTDGGTANDDDLYYWAQLMHKVSRGFHTLFTYEVYNADNGTTETSTHRVTMGIQWFPRSRIEIRSEVSALRVFSDANSDTDQWRFLNQLHLWF